MLKDVPCKRSIRPDDIAAFSYHNSAVLSALITPHTQLNSKNSKMSTSPKREGSANEGSSNGNLEEKPRLSEHEKKANHIASGTFPPPLSLPSLPLPFSHLIVNTHSQNKNADKQSAKVSTASPSLCRA